MKFIYRNILKITVLLVSISLYVLLPLTDNYNDPFSLCTIDINSSVKGDRKTIKGALGKIKKEDPEKYKNVCKYVDTINEDFCYAKDSHAEKEEFVQPYCYIKGSKTIHLLPLVTPNDSGSTQRAEMIKKYAEFSKNFWESQPH